MPMVNNDRKHYTPCFILQEEQVLPSPFRITMLKMIESYSALIAINYNPMEVALL